MRFIGSRFSGRDNEGHGNCSCIGSTATLSPFADGVGNYTINLSEM